MSDEQRELLQHYQDAFYKLTEAYAELVAKNTSGPLEFTENELIILMDELDCVYSLKSVTYPQAIIEAVNNVIGKRVSK